MARRPSIKTALPGPKAAAVISMSEHYVSNSYTRDYPLVAEQGSGCWITDIDGNEFLDMTAGIAVTATGHCHPEITKVISEQAGRLLHMSGTDFYYSPQARYASEICKHVPVKGGRARVYFGNSGAEAVEAAMKLARWKTRRPNFISFFNAFHGRTFGAVSLTASKVIQKTGFAP
ncbi:MAG: aminotransferase class III-fold pyridoxal phosphate-dependent enzyme, partial [Proteobacteria bacterium]|nr:aminotransferase class III-fold pyridoxal phosphate-dependent enzyme [Pseudomonadota bacterium]